MVIVEECDSAYSPPKKLPTDGINFAERLLKGAEGRGKPVGSHVTKEVEFEQGLKGRVGFS